MSSLTPVLSAFHMEVFLMIAGAQPDASLDALFMLFKKAWMNRDTF